MASLFELPPFLEAGRDSLPIFLQAYSHPEYKSDAVIVYGMQPENADLYPQEADMVAEWSRLYAYPKMKFSGFAEPMEYIAKQFGDSFPWLGAMAGLIGNLAMVPTPVLCCDGARDRAAGPLGGENRDNQHACQPSHSA